MLGNGGPWVAGRSLRWHQRSRRPRATLVCLPPAGSAAGFYRSWVGELEADIDMLAVQYPGRQDRIREPFAPDLVTLAEDIVAELVPALRAPLVVFGHSFGAAVGYEMALRLQLWAPGAPAHLIVSGRPGPAAHRGGTTHLQSDRELWDTVVTLGGIEPELLAMAELQELVLPPMREDYRLVETYRPNTGAPVLRTPVTALLGDTDPQVSPPEAATWGRITGAEFTCRTFPGGHFYLLKHRSALLSDISSLLVSVSEPQPPDTPGRPGPHGRR